MGFKDSIKGFSSKPDNIIRTPYGDFHLAKGDKKRVQKMIIDLQRATDALTRQDMQVGIEQTLSLERGSRVHDDAPDADEGAIWYLQRNTRQESFKPMFGARPTSKNIW